MAMENDLDNLRLTPASGPVSPNPPYEIMTNNQNATWEHITGKAWFLAQGRHIIHIPGGGHFDAFARRDGKVALQVEDHTLDVISIHLPNRYRLAHVDPIRGVTPRYTTGKEQWKVAETDDLACACGAEACKRYYAIYNHGQRVVVRHNTGSSPRHVVVDLPGFYRIIERTT